MIEVLRNDVLIAVFDAGRVDFKRHFGVHVWSVNGGMTVGQCISGEMVLSEIVLTVARLILTVAVAAVTGLAHLRWLTRSKWVG